MRGSSLVRLLAPDRALLPGARCGLELLPFGHVCSTSTEQEQPSAPPHSSAGKGPVAWCGPHGARAFSSSTASSSGNIGMSPLEALSLVLSPSQLGAQVWEAGHSLTGLPWWASIPLTTLAMRTALAPLSAKARAASANWILLDAAIKQARVLGSGLEPAERAQLRKPVRTILRALRARHGVPTWRWYTLNTLVQGSLFLSLTGGLSVMSAALWPGLVDQGTLYFKDLTAPPLYPQHLSTPYGTMGTVLPLLGVLMHVRAVDNSAAVRTQSVSWASRLLILPVYLMALVQPHAVLLYWLTMGATHLAITGPLSKRGALSRAFGIPAMLLPDAPSADSGSSAGSSSSSSAAASEGDGELVKGDNILSDPSLLVAVGSDFLSHRNAAAAAACFSKAVSAAEGFGNEVVRGEAYLGLARAQLKQQQMAEAQAAAGQLEGLLQGSLAGMLFAGDEGATKLQAGLESVQQELKAAGKQ